MSWKETDPLRLWQTATTVPQPYKTIPDIGDKTDLTERFSGNRTKLWQSLFEMSPNERANYLHRLVTIWPNKLERYAFKYPLGVQVLAGSFTHFYIYAKVNADVFFLNKKMSLLESIKRSPKQPVFFALLTGLVIQQAPQWILVYKPMIEHQDKPDGMRVFRNSAAISVLTNVAVPLLSTPYLSHYAYMRQYAKADPLAKNYIDLITLSYELTRSIWRKIPLLIGIQVAVSAACTYVALWGREKIYETIDVDSELIRNMMEEEPRAHFLENILNKVQSFYAKAFGLFGGEEMNEREAIHGHVKKILEGD